MNIFRRIIGEPTPKRPVKVLSVEELRAKAAKAKEDSKKALEEADATQELFEANQKLAEANEALRLAKRGEYSK
jgi:hypothetical protein